jgi:hypothetical protein
MKLFTITIEKPEQRNSVAKKMFASRTGVHKVHSDKRVKRTNKNSWKKQEEF